MKKQSFTKRFKQELPFHLMLLVPVIFVIIFKYLPFGGLVMAFQDYKPVRGLFDQEWVGLQNFIYLFKIPGFKNVLRNTIFIALSKIILNLIIPVIFALLLNELRSNKFKRTVQTVSYLPHFISWVALAGVLTDILSPGTGIINQVIKGLGFEPVFFLGDPKIFPFTMIISDVWKELGWNSIVYLAAITGVDVSLYEAARVDGANRWKQIWHVTLPTIAPFIMLMMVLNIGGVLSAGFDQVVSMYSTMVYSTGDILDTYIYRVGLIDSQFGLATAVGLIKSIVSMILMLVGYRVADKVSGYRVF